MKNLRNKHIIMLPEISVIFGEDVTDLDCIHRIHIYPKRVDGRKKKLNPPVFMVGYDDQPGMHFMECEIPHDVTANDSLTEQEWITYAIKEVLIKCDRWSLKPKGKAAVLNDVRKYLEKLN